MLFFLYVILSHIYILLLIQSRVNFFCTKFYSLSAIDEQDTNITINGKGEIKLGCKRWLSKSWEKILKRDKNILILSPLSCLITPNFDAVPRFLALSNLSSTLRRRYSLGLLALCLTVCDNIGLYVARVARSRFSSHKKKKNANFLNYNIILFYTRPRTA